MRARAFARAELRLVRAEESEAADDTADDTDLPDAGRARLRLLRVEAEEPGRRGEVGRRAIVLLVYTFLCPPLALPDVEYMPPGAAVLCRSLAGISTCGSAGGATIIISPSGPTPLRVPHFSFRFASFAACRWRLEISLSLLASVAKREAGLPTVLAMNCSAFFVCCHEAAASSRSWALVGRGGVGVRSFTSCLA